MKGRFLVGLALALVAGGLLFFSNWKVTAQESQPTITPYSETQGDASRAVENIFPNGLTSATWMSNPYCYQPDTTRNECFVNIRYSQATQDGTAAPYLYNIEISINGKLRYNSSVFFENSIYYNYDMALGGLKLACGTPNEGGAGTAYGKVYTVFVEGKTYDGTSMGWGSAAVRCPAYAP